MSLSMLGAFAVTLLIDAMLLAEQHYITVITNIVLLAIVINDFLSPLFIRRALRKIEK